MEAVHAAAPSESAIGRLGDAPLMSYEIDARTRRRSSVPLIARSDLDNDLDGGLEAEAAKRAAASLARATCLDALVIDHTSRGAMRWRDAEVYFSLGSGFLIPVRVGFFARANEDVSAPTERALLQVRKEAGDGRDPTKRRAAVVVERYAQRRASKTKGGGEGRAHRHASHNLTLASSFLRWHSRLSLLTSPHPRLRTSSRLDS